MVQNLFSSFTRETCSIVVFTRVREKYAWPNNLHAFFYFNQQDRNFIWEMP